jgi:hypothetical protein
MKLNKNNLGYNTLSTICFLSGSYILYLSYGLNASIGVGLEVLAVYIGIKGGFALSKTKKEDKDN